MSDCLIVGGDSPIGKALADRLRASGLTVFATSRRAQRAGDRPFLDLETLEGAERLPATRYVALVAAETKFATCAAEPERTARTNVEAPVALARHAIGHGARVLFFSSIAVHDGSVDRPPEDAVPTPNSVYGEQKRAAEQRLSELAGDIAIVRPSKVIAPDFDLFVGWLNSLGAAEAVEAFTDMKVAPIGLAFLADTAARLLTADGAAGVFQISAADQVSYADIARYIARRVGAPRELVRSISAAERLDARTLWLPQWARLGCGRLQSSLKVAPPNPFDCVDALLDQHR